MSDRPLFQDADEQEAKLAPQQLPGVPEQITADGIVSDTESGVPLAAVPLVATAGAASIAGPGYAGGSAGTVSGAVPAIGAAALAEELERDDENEAKRRD